MNAHLIIKKKTMISKIYTYKEKPVSANELVLYRFLATMFTIRKFKKITLPKLQVYLWGLKSEENKHAVMKWKKEGRITNAPWLMDDDTPQLISQCICNHYVQMDLNKSGKVSYVLDYAATQIFQEMRGTEIEGYITSDLEDMGPLTDTMLASIVFDF